MDESGATGFVTLGLLKQLEDVLNENESPPKVLGSYFNLIISSGPSSFIAAKLAIGYSVKEIFDHYHIYIKTLFSKKFSWWNPFQLLQAQYSSRKANSLLNEMFGDITLQDECFHTKFGIFTYNIEKESVSIFTNFKIPHLRSHKCKPLLRDVILASSSFPTYHKPHVITDDYNHRYVAGSVGTTNNPTLSAAFFLQKESETIKWNMNADQLFFLSLGRGEKNV